MIADYPQLNGLIAMVGIQQPEDWHKAEGFLQVAETSCTPIFSARSG